MSRLKEIIHGAIKEEEHFMNFYKQAAEKIETESAKEVLMTLSEQEKGHKEKLEALDLEMLDSKTIPSKVETIQVGERLMLTPINEFRELKEIFNFAIKAEQTAQNMYLHLTKAVDDADAKQVFELLAVEEKKHEALLKAELGKLGI